MYKSDISRRVSILLLLGLCLTLLPSCGGTEPPQQQSGQQSSAAEQPSEAPVAESQQAEQQESADMAEDDLQEEEELSEWEELYERWQEGPCETELSLGNEIYSVSAQRHWGADGEGISVTYEFVLDDAEKEKAVELMTQEEHKISNNVLKADMTSDSVKFVVADDSGCVKEIGIPAAADEGNPVYFVVNYLFPYRDKGDVSISFAGELAYEEWKELAELADSGIKARPLPRTGD